MRQKSKSTPVSSEGVVRDIRRATRKRHAAEEKIRIVLDGLRGETSIAELCRRESGRRAKAELHWTGELGPDATGMAVGLRVLKKATKNNRTLGW